MTDHPPAIPAIGVRHVFVESGDSVESVLHAKPGQVIVVRNLCGVWHHSVPLGLSPEQPCRIGGHDE